LAKLFAGHTACVPSAGNKSAKRKALHLRTVNDILEVITGLAWLPVEFGFVMRPEAFLASDRLEAISVSSEAPSAGRARETRSWKEENGRLAGERPS
jgi:hypothetical protein